MEVMIALAILALALPILLGLRNWDLSLRAQADTWTQATLLAQEKLLETELQGGLPPIGEQSGEFTGRLPGFQFATAPKDRASGFRWKRTVAPTPFDTIREVRIRISWPRGDTEETLEVTHYALLESKPAS